MKKSWTSILNGAAQVTEDTAEYVFETDDKIVSLPPSLDAKHAAIKKLIARNIELSAEAHRIQIERDRLQRDMERLQDAIAETLKGIGLQVGRPWAANDKEEP